ncbi:ZN862-like protein, partial [Mya arenaria]
MTLLYWLVKEEIPQHTKFESLVDTIKGMGMDVLNMLTLGGNANYTSNDFVNKTVVLFGNVIFRDIVAEIQQSPFYSVMIDETTDIATHSQLSIYVRYLHQGASKTVFCSLVKVHNGKSDTIRAAVVQFLRDAKLPLNKMCTFGSDGAAAMLGKKNGVAAQLQTMVPHILVNHCVAHRLALASSQAAEKVPYLLKWKANMEQLFRFYHASGVRTASLLEIQTILEEPKVKVTEAKDVRWLSHNKAVKAIRRCLPSLLTSLEHEARERCDAVAQGLAIFMQQYRFVAALMMMSDMLPVLANLSLALQTKDAVYSTVGTLVMGAITTVRSMKEHPELKFRELPVTIGQLSDQPFRFQKPSANT